MKIIRPIKINDARLLSSNVPENDAPAYNPATTYNLGDEVLVLGIDIHRVYRSQKDGNLGEDPLGEVQNDPANPPLNWVLLGSNNRWRMLDQSRSSQTSQAESMTYVFHNLGPLDAIFISNLVGQFVHIKVTEVLAGVVYDKTTSLISNRGATTLYDFFYEPYSANSEFLALDLPKYVNTTVEISILNPGAIASCGECILGLSREIGGTQYGVTTSITDYSIKQFDEFGTVSVLERAYSDNASMTVFVEAGVAYEIKKLLTQYRAKPIVYIGDVNNRSTWIYGFYKDFTENIQYEDLSVYTLELEGLS